MEYQFSVNSVNSFLVTRCNQAIKCLLRPSRGVSYNLNSEVISGESAISIYFLSGILTHIKTSLVVGCSVITLLSGMFPINLINSKDVLHIDISCFHLTRLNAGLTNYTELLKIFQSWTRHNHFNRPKTPLEQAETDILSSEAVKSMDYNVLRRSHSQGSYIFVTITL